MTYTLSRVPDVSPWRRQAVARFPSIEAAIAAIPGGAAHWSRDDDGHDAADAIAFDGTLYVVEA